MDIPVKTAYGYDVYPLNDLKPHNDGPNCWCKPSVEDCANGDLVIHNALDGREKYETGERKPS